MTRLARDLSSGRASCEAGFMKPFLPHGTSPCGLPLGLAMSGRVWRRSPPPTRQLPSATRCVRKWSWHSASRLSWRSGASSTRPTSRAPSTCASMLLQRPTTTTTYCDCDLHHDFPQSAKPMLLKKAYTEKKPSPCRRPPWCQIELEIVSTKMLFYENNYIHTLVWFQSTYKVIYTYECL